MGPSASNKFELQQQLLRSMDPKLQVLDSLVQCFLSFCFLCVYAKLNSSNFCLLSLQKQESSMEPPSVNHYQLQQQQLRLMEPQSLVWDSQIVSHFSCYVYLLLFSSCYLIHLVWFLHVIVVNCTSSSSDSSTLKCRFEIINLTLFFFFFFLFHCMFKLY